MALFRITRPSDLPAAEAWRRLTRWERHADLVPLTRIEVETPPPTGVGTRFTARTGAGPLRFDDPMEVVRWQPPDGGAAGLCRLEKRGRVVTGWAEIAVRPRGSGCEVEWREEIRVRLVPSAADPVTALSGRLVFGRALHGLLSRP